MALTQLNAVAVPFAVALGDKEVTLGLVGALALAAFLSLRSTGGGADAMPDAIELDPRAIVERMRAAS